MKIVIDVFPGAETIEDVAIRMMSFCRGDLDCPFWTGEGSPISCPIWERHKEGSLSPCDDVSVEDWAEVLKEIEVK